MKGLERYLKKHGRHFTLELAHDVCRRKWSAVRIKDGAQERVYFNVTGSTDGDMVYLMDTFRHFLSDQYTWNKALKLMLKWVGDYKKTGSPFSMWLSRLYTHDEEFDLTPYI